MNNQQQIDPIEEAIALAQTYSPELLWLTCHAAVGCESVDQLTAEISDARVRCERFCVSAIEIDSLLAEIHHSPHFGRALLTLARAYAHQHPGARRLTARGQA